MSFTVALFSPNTRSFVSEEDTHWANLASRVVRVVLARKDFSYATLSEALAALGVIESERSLASRISRGRIRLALLLQILDATGAKAPRLWEAAIMADGTWEDRAAAVVLAELARHPTVTLPELARRLVLLGADLTEKTLLSHLSTGALSLPAFLQCIVALGSSSLDCYLDYEDLVLAVAIDRR
ncbi:DUF6471 domain-containing protein [Paraburkholderia fungorum]|uniref:DUF6471 domain-containing protein n=1 Tax=Paraburkholderia fungorum TaxID=134537 RepID=UPI0038BC649A